MKPILTVFCLSILFIIGACSKDKFETKPRLEIKDYSSREVPKDGILRIRLNYFDKEGDLSESQFTAIRMRLNKTPLSGSDFDKNDTILSVTPTFPAKDNGEMTLQYEWDFLNESRTENDTIIFRFAVTDQKGNNSDTLNTDQIVIRYQ